MSSQDSFKPWKEEEIGRRQVRGVWRVCHGFPLLVSEEVLDQLAVMCQSIIHVDEVLLSVPPNLESSPDPD